MIMALDGLPTRAYVRHRDADTFGTVTAGPFAIHGSDQQWYTVEGDDGFIYQAPEAALERATGANAGVPKGHRHEHCEVLRLADYPYECVTADLYPSDLVFVCAEHHCWWSLDYRTREKRQALYERHPS